MYNLVFDNFLDSIKISKKCHTQPTESITHQKRDFATMTLGAKMRIWCIGGFLTSSVGNLRPVTMNSLSCNDELK